MSDNSLEPGAIGLDTPAASALATEIRRRRTLAGLSHTELATRIGYSRQYLSRAERARRGPASADLVRAIDTALNAGGALTELHSQALAERKARRSTPTPTARSAEQARSTDATKHRARPAPVDASGARSATTIPSGDHDREVGAIHPGAMANAPAASDRWPHTDSAGFTTFPHRHPTADMASPLTPPDVTRPGQSSAGRRRRLTPSSPAHLDEIMAHLQEQWHALVRTDNLLGPRFAIAGVLSQTAAIEELCASLRGQQRIELVRLGAQYAESAAWLYEDAGDIAQARYWTSRAMELAHEGDDARLLAWAIFRRSQQAAAALDAPQAIGFAQAARRNEERLAAPTRAAIRVQEAYGHALDGEQHAAQTLLDEAHTWAASDTAGNALEGHGSYCTPTYIEIQRANCWLTTDTSKPKKAIAIYEESIHALPFAYQRSRAAALSRLAMAYIADGQVEEAASAAHTALPIARSGGSMRIVDEIKDTGNDLAPHRELPEVASLLDDLNNGEEP